MATSEITDVAVLTTELPPPPSHALPLGASILSSLLESGAPLTSDFSCAQPVDVPPNYVLGEGIFGDFARYTASLNGTLDSGDTGVVYPPAPKAQPDVLGEDIDVAAVLSKLTSDALALLKGFDKILASNITTLDAISSSLELGDEAESGTAEAVNEFGAQLDDFYKSVNVLRVVQSIARSGFDDGVPRSVLDSMEVERDLRKRKLEELVGEIETANKVLKELGEEEESK